MLIYAHSEALDIISRYILSTYSKHERIPTPLSLLSLKDTIITHLKRQIFLRSLGILLREAYGKDAPDGRVRDLSRSQYSH